ncbi:hypothetical protein LUZ60_001110 [Juncus effusus]|nr:hypothetical protein LUZ60_001110 [Juncus effusus]
MVRFLKRGNSLERFFKRKEMLEQTERKAHSLILDGNNREDSVDDKMLTRSQGSRTSSYEGQQIGSVFDKGSEKGIRSRLSKDVPSDVDLMKEKFAKLLLGEDMSGSGKGVSSSLALSNAITNLAASVFGEQRRLEPMQADSKARWKKEISWLLSVADHIVEFVPTKQVSSDGTTMEVMRNQQRKDLYMSIPALKKLDAMLLEYLDNFKDMKEFWYEKKNGSDAQREDDKWWLPTVKVPPNGLSEVTKVWLQNQKEHVNQVLKAAMAINANVLMEMEIPDTYIDSLPKNGRASLGDSLYKNITDEFFDPYQFLASTDLSTEHKIVDLKNKIEASIVIWKRKMTSKDSKSSWGSGVSLEKREQFEERAETLLLIIKERHPGIPQSTLDISKIQENKDVGYAILESYSRILESLAFTVMSRIEDVLYADSLARDPTLGGKRRPPPSNNSDQMLAKPVDPNEEMERVNNMEMPASATLLDFMGWNMDKDEKTESGNLGEMMNKDEKLVKKPPNNPPKRFSYIESLGGLRSPTISRH